MKALGNFLKSLINTPWLWFGFSFNKFACNCPCACLYLKVVYMPTFTFHKNNISQLRI